MSIARTEVPRLELYEATGSSRRIQKDFPAGIYSQLAEARAGENNNRSSNKAPPRHNNRGGRRDTTETAGLGGPHHGLFNFQRVHPQPLITHEQCALNWSECLDHPSSRYAQSTPGTAYRGSRGHE